MQLGEKAVIAKNADDAQNYANRALQLDPQSYRAWLVKLQSPKHITSVLDFNEQEAIEYGENAKKYAPEDKKEDIYSAVESEYMKLYLLLLDISEALSTDFRDSITQIDIRNSKMHILRNNTPKPVSNKISSSKQSIVDQLNAKIKNIENYIPNDKKQKKSSETHNQFQQDNKLNAHSISKEKQVQKKNIGCILIVIILIVIFLVKCVGDFIKYDPTENMTAYEKIIYNSDN